jgi:putative MATE family efflux protein
VVDEAEAGSGIGPLAQTATPSPHRLAPRTQLLLHGPILRTLLRLSIPNLGEAAARVAFVTFDAIFVGQLVGPAALAGVSLVFPLVILMQTMSAAGMGSGVSSAIARAFGAGKRAEANALAGHAVALAAIMAGLFMIVILPAGPALYRAMGGEGEVYRSALVYSNVIFGGAIAMWLMNMLANVVRGTGNMVVPAGAIVGSEVIHLALSPALIAGWGPFPQLGVAGAGVAIVAAYAGGALILTAFLLSGRALVQLPLRGFRVHRGMLKAILRVGLFGSLSNLQSQASTFAITAFMGGYGTFALAGYGAATRLEIIQMPLIFAFGSALIAMVGTNVGANLIARARRIAWIGGAIGAAISGAIGLYGALFADSWLRLFNASPEVIASGAAYLHTAGPAYVFFGAGLALYSGAAGAGRVFWPFLAGTIRLVIVAAGGWCALNWLGAGLDTMFVIVAAGLVVFGVVVAVSVKLTPWRGGEPR